MIMRAMVCGRMTNMALIDSNVKTVWVEITGRIIKRHRVKHRVEELTEEPDVYMHGDRLVAVVPWYRRVWRWLVMVFSDIDRKAQEGIS